MSIIKEIMAYVKKAILITYTESDIHDILSACLAKRWLDGLYHSDGTRFDSVIDETDITSLTEKYNEHLKLLIDYQDKFKPCTDFGNRILNISWSEIMNEDTNDFVSKLSDFINRDIDKFDVDVIHEWQQRTKKCIRYMQPIISKIKEQHE
jgi:hypothetical protein